MDSKYAQIVRAVELYYLENLTQQEIAKIMNISRPTVSRLLEEGKRLGVVTINVNTPAPIDGKLSEILRKKLKLKDVMVVDVEDVYPYSLDKVSKAAALFFTSILKPSSIIGISWGTSLKAFVDKLAPIEVSSAQVVQIVGSLGTEDSDVDGGAIVYQISKKLGCSHKIMNAPAVLSSKNVLEELKNQKIIMDTIKLAEKANIFVSSIGSLNEEKSSIQLAGYLTEEEKKVLLNKGGVGHLLTRVIDKDGNELGIFNERVLSVDLEYLRNAEWAIGISVGKIKAEAMLAATLGKYFNCIIIDKACAEEMINLMEGRDI